MRQLVAIFALALALVGCAADGLPAAQLDDGGDDTCGKAGVVCCGEDGGNSTLWWCDPGLRCNVHRGGPPALCAPADGGTP